ncbi:hypothetical protein K493DRAFT_301084 [Basidiobolus meristosporus CBS 931.73]|uniref:Uncharacterized protein n=1 Tax=Basidiobolus meristosporus CBS 931.73 TaxID=1314790 RepID=A0A1Y1YDP3_9FUNG|nr:hypothetical protein K493DRAFT_301084 [Basidiobolus meristosporus CBS 931.73]|eukprot:ORX96140.1 hypothetical protein K493DRAFT_301084 [Basidiobolus meristosporus CBS 931.73]
MSYLSDDPHTPQFLNKPTDTHLKQRYYRKRYKWYDADFDTTNDWGDHERSFHHRLGPERRGSRRYSKSRRQTRGYAPPQDYRCYERERYASWDESDESGFSSHQDESVDRYPVRRRGDSVEAATRKLSRSLQYNGFPLERKNASRNCRGDPNETKGSIGAEAGRKSLRVEEMMVIGGVIACRYEVTFKLSRTHERGLDFKLIYDQVNGPWNLNHLKLQNKAFPLKFLKIPR